ncbi:MAG TPA: 2-hydroxyacyl-CoA dehydratase [Spirochaetes bacterium]|nr:2-hydroxyacyl-CoA dehydratase [Spirochaetota bacterium]
MRPATREYNFDWMLLSTYEAASKLTAGTEKEYRRALRYVPYFSGILDAMNSIGEPGELFIKTCALYLRNLVNAKKEGRKNAMTTFCFSPVIFYAMDITPVCLEVLTVFLTLTYRRGSAEFLDYCNEIGFTETSCSAQRGSLGAFLAGIGADIDMVVTDTPGVCDTNANAFAFAAAFMDKPFFQLDMPPVLAGERYDRYHRDDYRALIAFLEKMTGAALDPERLAEILTEFTRQDELIAELEELGRLKPSPLPPAFNLLTYAAKFLFAGMKPCTELLESMLRAARRNAEEGRSGLAGGVERLRGFFCYIDHFTCDMRLWKMLEELGISTQANILSVSWSPDTAHVKLYGKEHAAYHISTENLDAMIDSLALANARMPMVKSIRGPYDSPDMWLDDTLALATMYRSDFIVYSGTPGCRNTWGMVKPYARETEKAGFPTHIMNSDAFDDRVQSWESARDRLEEFFKVRGLL